MKHFPPASLGEASKWIILKSTRQFSLHAPSPLLHLLWWNISFIYCWRVSTFKPFLRNVNIIRNVSCYPGTAFPYKKIHHQIFPKQCRHLFELFSGEWWRMKASWNSAWPFLSFILIAFSRGRIFGSTLIKKSAPVSSTFSTPIRALDWGRSENLNMSIAPFSSSTSSRASQTLTAFMGQRGQ